MFGSAATCYLFWADAAYFLRSRSPHDLGEASELTGSTASNQFVRLRGVADLRGSLRVGLRGGDLRLVRLSGSGVLAQVPAPAPPGTPPRGEGGLAASGLFDGRGRLWRAEDAPSFYRPVLRRFRQGGPVRFLLVTGDEPPGAWGAFAAVMAVIVLGTITLVLAARAMVRRRRVATKAAAGVADGDSRS